MECREARVLRVLFRVLEELSWGASEYPGGV